MIRLRPGMWLDIGEAAIEEPLRALDREPLRDIHELAPAIVAPPGIALSVFVGQHRTLRLQYRTRDDILAGDQLDLRLLSVKLAGNGRGQFRVGNRERLGEKTVALRRRRRESG